MDWHAIEVVTGILCALAAAISVYTVLTIKASIADLRTEIANQRTDDAAKRNTERDELKSWINGSFMRAAIVKGEIDGVTARVDRLEGEVFNLPRAA